jgi:serine/threonine protein kinase
MPLTPATRLGPYEIIAPLGAGGMGEVYRARDTRLKRDIAIKVLPDDVASSPERLARFEREATTVAGLNHPNIVVLHSIEEVQRHALPHHGAGGGAEPRSLGHPGEDCPRARVIELGIAWPTRSPPAHEKGVIHRDLKARERDADEGRTDQVLDFGLAKLATPDSNLGAHECGRP